MLGRASSVTDLLDLPTQASTCYHRLTYLCVVSKETWSWRRQIKVSGIFEWTQAQDHLCEEPGAWVWQELLCGLDYLPIGRCNQNKTTREILLCWTSCASLRRFRQVSTGRVLYEGETAFLWHAQPHSCFFFKNPSLDPTATKDDHGLIALARLTEGLVLSFLVGLGLPDQIKYLCPTPPLADGCLNSCWPLNQPFVGGVYKTIFTRTSGAVRRAIIMPPMLELLQ